MTRSQMFWKVESNGGPIFKQSVTFGGTIVMVPRTITIMLVGGCGARAVSCKATIYFFIN